MKTLKNEQSNLIARVTMLNVGVIVALFGYVSFIFNWQPFFLLTLSIETGKEFL